MTDARNHTIGSQTGPVSGCRLSPQQELVLRSEAESRARYAQVQVRVAGTLDRETLEQALDRVSRRHEILRTVFRRQIGRRTPFQVVEDLPLVSVEQVTEIVDVPPVDGSSGPVLRAFVSSSGGDSDLVLALPAACADSATLTLLVDELAALYAARPSTTAAPVQYADYAEWQYQTIAGTDETATAGREYWKAAAEMSTPLWLPLAGPGTNRGKGDPQRIDVPVSADVGEELIGLAQSTGVPLMHVWLASWQALMARVAGAARVSSRIVLDGRSSAELADALGPYAKAVPLSVDVDDASFVELIRRTSTAVDEAEKWQDYFACEDGSADVAEFEWITGPESASAARAIGWTIAQRSVSASPFALKLACEVVGDAARGTIWYDAAAMREADAARVADQYAALLKSVAAAPETALGAVSLRPQAGDLARASGGSAAPPATRMDAWIAAQAAATPEAIAVAGSDERLTYAVLLARAAAIAAWLAEAGVRPGAVVGVCGERSAALLASVLGVWQAGAAYLPLGPDQPVARVADQLAESAAAAAIVTDARSREVLAHYNAPVLVLSETSLPQASAPPSVGTPEDVAYVLYTSGSTGRPKGVVVRHRNLAAYTAALVERVRAAGVDGAGMQWATVSALTADLGNTCIFPALVSGGCVHMVPPPATLDGAALGAYMARHRVDVLKITPSHLAAVLDEHGAVLPRRALICGGEALSWELVAQVRARGTCAVWNHYGPTETTVGALMYQVAATPEPTPPAPTRTVPIGRPIGQTTIAVVDTAGDAVPLGIAGELWIGGPSVAAGYLHQPALTAERFVTPRWAPDATWYRTGDRVRMNADAAVEFLGRVDDQVKIRGYRVEPGEVEHTLLTVAGVREGAVVVTGDALDHRLAAHVVVEPGTSVAGIRAALQTRLPDYMVPDTLTIVETLPRLANGKVDRRRLAMSVERAVSAASTAEPRSPVEATLCEIWQTLLVQPSVGIHDNFFELGGHSLLATQAIAQARRAFGVQLPLAAIFDAPTVAGLADAVAQLTAEAAADPEIDQILASVEGMSEAEVLQLLENEASNSDKV